MKVLITTGIFPPEIGGPARIIERLSLDLQARGIGVTVLTYGVKKDDKYPFPVIRENNKIKFAWRLWCSARQADIIYTLDLYTPGLLSWLIGKVLRGKKLVVRFAGDSAWEKAASHDNMVDNIVDFQNKKYSWLVEQNKKWRRKILRGADKVVAVSDFMKEIAIKIGVFADKVEVIYNSADFMEIAATHQPDVRGQLASGDEKVIMTAGRLVPWKGVDGLIRAINELKQVGLRIKLAVLGDGPDCERLKKIIAENGLNDTVLLLGRINMNEIFNYYRAADIFVLNSQYEGLSHVLLEVLSVGVSVIASNCGGNPEVIENEKNGLLVEYNNVDQISAAIKRMLIEEKWRTNEYKNNCRESLKKFSWQNVIEQTIKIFKNVQGFINQPTI